MLIPSTSLSLTARSTVLSVSFVESTTDFCNVTLDEKAARGTDVVAKARGTTWRVATRRAAASVRKDILFCFFGLFGVFVMCVWKVEVLLYYSRD